MAAPTLNAVTATTTGSASSTITVNIPTGVVAGSVVIALCFTDTGTSVTGFGTSGLAHATGSPLPPRVGGSYNLNVLWKRATGSEGPGTYTLTLSASAGFWTAGACRIDGAISSGNPWDTNSGTGTAIADTNVSGSVNSQNVSMTTQFADELLFLASSQFNGGTWTFPGGFTKDFTDSAAQVETFGDKAQAVAGATGTLTISVSGTAAEMATWLGGLLADTGGAPTIGYTPALRHPGGGPGKWMFSTSPRSTDLAVTISGSVTMTGAGTLTALATQGVIETSTGAGTLTNAATLGAIETSSGAGTLTNAATQGSNVTATGAGVVTNSPTQGSGGNLIGGGTLNPLVTLGAVETVTGSGVLSDAAVEQAIVSLTGAGTLTDVVTIRATVSMVGAGTLTASSGQSANMTGAGTLSATPTLLAPANLTGAGSLSATVQETATAALSGAGTVAAPNVLKAPVAATGAGILTANGTAPGSSSGEIWGVAT